MDVTFKINAKHYWQKRMWPKEVIQEEGKAQLFLKGRGLWNILLSYTDQNVGCHSLGARSG